MNIPEVDSPRTLLETVKFGKYAVKVYWELDDIALQASGFTMQFLEKLNSPPRLKRDTRPASSLLDDPTYLQQLQALGERWRAEVHARIRRDWGVKCFQADANGLWHHPLFVSAGTRFSCVHCEQTFPGAVVAAHLWRCPAPDCDGGPLDLHACND